MMPPWQETVLSTGPDNGIGLLGVDKASGEVLGEVL